MVNYNPNIHHRRSIRLTGYDYAKAGLYFITICCHNRICHFGHVENGEMVLNEFGKIAYNEWMKTPELRNNVELGEFIIMPNHMHGIIRLIRRGELNSPENISLNSPENISLNSPENISLNSPANPIGDSIKNEIYISSQIQGEFHSPLRGPSNNIGAIVRGYKSSVTKQLNLLNIGCPVWQRNYYENIIRNEESNQRISEYIINNPAKWAVDKFYGK